MDKTVSLQEVVKFPLEESFLWGLLYQAHLFLEKAVQGMIESGRSVASLVGWIIHY